MLYESIEHADDAVVRFRNKVFLKKIESNAWEFNEFFITKQIEKPRLALLRCKALRKRLEHSRSGEKHSTTSTTSRVSP